MQTRLNEKQIETYYCNAPTIIDSLLAQSTMLSTITQPLEEIINLFKNNEQKIYPENLTVECLAHYLGRIYLIGESSIEGVIVLERVEELSKKMEIFDEVLKVKNSITYQTLVDEQNSRIYPTYSAYEPTKKASTNYPANNSFLSKHTSSAHNTKITETNLYMESVDAEKKLTKDGVEGKITTLLNDLFGTKCSYDECLNTIKFIPAKSAEELRPFADQLITAGLAVKIEERMMLAGIIEVPA